MLLRDKTKKDLIDIAVHYFNFSQCLHLGYSPASHAPFTLLTPNEFDCLGFAIVRSLAPIDATESEVS